MAQTHVVEIDPAQPLREQPGTGHNRWHEGVEPIVEIDPGDTVVLGTRSGTDGQVARWSTSADIAGFDRSRVHPLTGPVAVRGVEPGDLLAIEVLQVIPDPWEHRGFTICSPRIGFLGTHIDEDLLVHWDLHGIAYADSPQLPGVRIPAAAFPGTLGVAPSRELRMLALEREAGALSPEPSGAVPAGSVGEEGLRTLPPRENAGNVDSRLLTAGSTLLVAAQVAGGLVSVGDVHFAQGDGEVCGTAIEMCSVVHLRIRVRPGGGDPGNGPWIENTGPRAQPGEGRPFVATTGTAPRQSEPGRADGLEAAVRQALLRMIDLLVGRGFTPAQAYVLCSVAVDIRISQLVNTPTVGATAVLPLDILA